MDLLPGFVFLPRSTGFVRPTGAFFSAVVEARVGPETWKVRLNGRSQIVTTTLSLTPGQVLKLRVAGQETGRWLLQAQGLPSPSVSVSGPDASGTLVAAFLSRGLSVATERLAAWSRWLAKTSPSVDREAWAASLEARGQGPASSLAEAVRPWLEWQAALERGQPALPPQEETWDEWNRRPQPQGDPWIVVPLRWSYAGREEVGLLQARWNAPAQSVDRWNLTASPAGTPFRLEARAGVGCLDLDWYLFVPSDRQKWQARVAALAAAWSLPDMTVTLRIPEKPVSVDTFHGGGIDVQA